MKTAGQAAAARAMTAGRMKLLVLEEAPECLWGLVGDEFGPFLGDVGLFSAASTHESVSSRGSSSGYDEREEKVGRSSSSD